MEDILTQTSPLVDEILKILGERELSFKEFMDLALYHSDYGYYSAAAEPGRKGDFFTSVSVGSCFGELLGIDFHQSWESKGCPATFVVMEQGGNRGTLAADILGSLYANFPAFYKCFQFLAIEKSPFAMSDSRLAAHDCWTCVSGLDGVKSESVDLAFSNELLDAFPVHRVTWCGLEAGWEEVYVVAGLDPGSLRCGLGPLTSSEIRRQLEQIDTTDFAPGYTTEIQSDILPWLGSMKRILSPGGKLLVIDYGLSGDAYHAASRSDGTLQAYHQHQRVTDLVARPGEQDLTAHLNFTQLQADADVLGFQVTRFEEQHRFLTSVATAPLLAMEKRLAGSAPDESAKKWVRQFQQLVSMGPAFKVIEFTNGEE
jgi:SAM-dependent MidA family methyltransferase